MAITGVLRAGHVAIRVLDLEAAHNHYTKVLGLIEVARDSSNRIYLKGWDEQDHHSVVLREAETPGMDYMGFKVAAKELLPRLERDLKAAGCSVERIPAGEHIGCGERIRFEVPTGHVIELYAEKELLGNGLPTVNPDPWPEGLVGMQVTRFDHCLLYGDDVEGTVRIFREVLGFDLAEQVMAGEAMIGAFLTCGAKPHDVAFIKDSGKGKFHHASFYLNNWGDVLRAADIISKYNVSHDIGPTRHGITRGETVYFFDPSGNRNEVFSGGYIRYPDHPTITWTDNELGKAIFYHDRKLNERFLSVTT